jgi:predicted dinucleotide-binding enzyme
MLCVWCNHEAQIDAEENRQQTAVRAAEVVDLEVPYHYTKKSVAVLASGLTVAVDKWTQL